MPCFNGKDLDGVLDIYTKLIIAIISFIAPLIIHLLSVFSDGIAVVRRRYQEEEKQMNTLLKNEIQEMKTDGTEISEAINTTNASFVKRKKNNKAKLQLLDPKRQIMRIFPVLFFSLAFIMIYKTAECKQWCNNIGLSLLLICSIILSVVGVWFLRNVAWAVIDVKQDMARDKEMNSQRSERITAQSTEKQKI
jgi:cell division protein FtsB